MNKAVRNVGKAALRSLHTAALRAGLVVLPNHYYTPIADPRRLAETKADWARRSELTGIDLDADAQIDWLTANVAPYEAEFRNNIIYQEGSRQAFGPGYGYIEAQCYHGVLRSLRPARIIEVGAGVSTWCAMAALKMNAVDGYPGTITVVEPYPSDFLRHADVRLIDRPVEQVGLDEFEALEPGDLLFIDSSHAVRPGGDVLHIYLSILPRLKPGVIVHIHDIYFPYLYQRDVLTTLFQWTETAMLAALLTNNQHLKVVVCLSLLTYDRPAGLQRVFPEYDHAPCVDGLTTTVQGHFPSSIYLQTQ